MPSVLLSLHSCAFKARICMMPSVLLSFIRALLNRLVRTPTAPPTQVGVGIGLRAVRELADEALDPAAVFSVARAARGTHGVEAVGRVRVRRSGPSLFCDIQVRIGGPGQS